MTGRVAPRRSNLRSAPPKSVAKCIACPEVIPFAFTEGGGHADRYIFRLLSPTSRIVGYAGERDGSITHCPACWERLA